MKIKLVQSLIATVGIGLMASTSPALANDITGTSAYHGTIKAVIPGYYYDIGVSLADGYTCNGFQQVLLLASNTHFTEIYSALLTAQVTHSTVALAQPAANPQSGYGFCTISEVAIGDFPTWP